MVGAYGVGDAVFGEVPAERLGDLLELGLGVGHRLPGALLEGVLQHGEDRPPRRLQPAIEVEGAEDRLHGVGEQGGLAAPARAVLPHPDAQGRSQVQLQGVLGQGVAADELRLVLGQLPPGSSGWLA